MATEAVLFDKDGTLFQFRATWEAWARVILARLAGGDAARAQRAGEAIGFDLASGTFRRDSIVIAGTPGEVAADLAPVFPEMSDAALLRVLTEEAEIAPLVEAVPLAPCMAGLRARGLRLGVATNDAEAVARANLADAGITEFFEFIAGCDSGHGAKPEPGQMLAFARHLGVAPGRCVMVGDSTHDLFAGRRAGMRTAAVLTGMAAAEELAPHADVVLPDISHLAAWLDRAP